MKPDAMKPVVSVVLCSYNQQRFLEQAITSVLDQTLSELELIAIDNGSDDSSADLIRSFGDPRIRPMLFESNDAISKRFNQGVREARGQFISFLYSDDFYLPEKLACQADALQRLPSDVGVVYSPSFRLSDATGEMWQVPCVRASGWVFKDLLLRYQEGSIDMIAPLFRRDVLFRHPFREVVFAEGEAILYRIALDYRFHFIEQPLVVERDHGSNAGKALRDNLDMTLSVMELLETEPSFTAAHRPPLDRFRATYLRASAWQIIRLGGDSEFARKLLRETWRYRRFSLLHPKVPTTFLMSLIPPRLRSAVNNIGNRLSSTRGEAVLVESYGGKASDYRPGSSSSDADSSRFE